MVPAGRQRFSKETTISKFFKRFAKRKSKHSSRAGASSIAVYAGILLVLFVVVQTGYKSPSVKNDSQVDSASIASAATAQSTESINNVDSASMAADVASSANLAVSDSVSSQSISLNTIAQLEQSDTTTAVKPQIANTTLSTEAFSSYVAVSGDTATSIAAKFGLTDQTIRWANDLTGDTVLVGTNMTIPVIDGVAYTTKDGDTLESIVSKYGSSVEQIISINNLDNGATTVAAGTKLLVPGGNLPKTEQPGYVSVTPAARAASSKSKDTGAATTTYVPYANGNTYAYGYCTWYAYNRRIQMGLSLPSNLGNANTWDDRARMAGYRVDRTPSVGAIFQTDAGYYGHVGVVERVNGDGTIEVSEMNNRAYGGWGKTNTRTITNPGDYKFIH